MKYLKYIWVDILLFATIFVINNYLKIDDGNLLKIVFILFYTIWNVLEIAKAESKIKYALVKWISIFVIFEFMNFIEYKIHHISKYHEQFFVGFVLSAIAIAIYIVFVYCMQFVIRKLLSLVKQ